MSTELDPRHLWKSFVWRVGMMLAVAGCVVFTYNLFTDYDQISQTSLKRAQAHFRDIMLTWHWNSRYGGVYVEKKPGIESNAFLEFPDVTSTDGRVFTLRDPDTMSRELSQMASQEGEYRFHTTSLRLKNPNNYPDAWERSALEAFEAGAKEAFEIVEEDGASFFRYMAPMRTEESCLTCHSDKAYKLDGVHGGISVSFDVSDLVKANHKHQILTALMILLSMSGVFLATRHYSRRLDQRLSEISRRDEALLAEQQAILQNAMVGIAFIRGRRIVSCNRRLEEIFGYSENEMKGHSTRMLYTSQADFEGIGLRAAAEFGAGRRFSDEFLLRRKSGESFWGAATGQTVDPSQPELGSIWIYADISVRHEAMKEANKLLRAVEQSPVSIVITDRNGTIEYVNPRFCQVTGFSREEAVGSNPRILKSGKTPKATYDQMWKTLLAGKEWRGELQNRHRDGEIFWEEVSISPIVLESGEITHYIAVKEDISKRKNLERRQEEHQAELERLVEKRTVDLRLALNAAHAADRAKSEFLANVSHEMRTPLNAVIGLSGLARKSVVDPRQLDYLEKINNAGQSLLEIINDLLDLSKIAAGHLQIECIPFSLRQSLDRVLASSAQALAGKKLTLSSHFDSELPERVLGDPLRLQQILLNLVTNAIKFTSEGEITVRFLQRSRSADQVELRVEVSDTGIGLTETEISRLFQPFSQADASITRNFGGTGLGLSICRRLAELMGGEIGVLSLPGAGSTFWVKLVFAVTGPSIARTAGASGKPDAQSIRYQNARVLVVDDQSINRQIARELLREVGIVCEEAETGLEALNRIRQSSAGYYGLVLMDIQMPEMDGRTASRKIRELPQGKDLPIIAMTAHVMTHEKQASLDAGMNEQLGKPFVAEDLYQIVAHWLPEDRRNVVGLQTSEATALKPESGSGQATAEGLPTIEGIEIETGLQRFAGNRAAYFGWLGKFRDEGDETLRGILQDLADGRSEEARKAVHTLKGRVGMLGMTALWQVIVDLERTLIENQPFDEPLAHARKMVKATQSALRNALANPDN